MKLKQWADKVGVKYLTAYRWFKDNKLPVKAYQTESGTIIVEDEEVLEMSPDVDFNVSDSTDVMSLFLRKTVEFSKNDAPVEDFAAWVISTFSLNFISNEIKPKYSKLKPSSSQIIKRYLNDINKNKGEKPKAQMFIPNNPKDLDDLINNDENLSAQDLVDRLSDLNCSLVKTQPVDGVAIPVDEQLFKELSAALKSVNTLSGEGSTNTGVFKRIETTPQNYANSTVTSSSLTSSDLSVSSSLSLSDSNNYFGENNPVCIINSTVDFTPTEKEVEGAKNLVTRGISSRPNSRGRGRPRKTEEEK